MLTYQDNTLFYFYETEKKSLYMINTIQTPEFLFSINSQSLSNEIMILDIYKGSKNYVSFCIDNMKNIFKNYPTSEILLTYGYFINLLETVKPYFKISNNQIIIGFFSKKFFELYYGKIKLDLQDLKHLTFSNNYNTIDLDFLLLNEFYLIKIFDLPDYYLFFENSFTKQNTVLFNRIYFKLLYNNVNQELLIKLNYDQPGLICTFEYIDVTNSNTEFQQNCDINSNCVYHPCTEYTYKNIKPSIKTIKIRVLSHKLQHIDKYHNIVYICIILK